MTTAFVLSRGAGLGATQAGMLQALYERDIRPDLFDALILDDAVPAYGIDVDVDGGKVTPEFRTT